MLRRPHPTHREEHVKIHIWTVPRGSTTYGRISAVGPNWKGKELLQTQRWGRARPAKGKTQVYREGEYTYGIACRKSQHMGHLPEYQGRPIGHASQVRGLALDASASSNFQRMPGGYSNSGFTNWGTLMKSSEGAHIPLLAGNGAASETQSQSSHTLPTLVPSTQG